MKPNSSKMSKKYRLTQTEAYGSQESVSRSDMAQASRNGKWKLSFGLIVLCLISSILLLAYDNFAEESTLKDFIFVEDGVIESLSAFFYFGGSLSLFSLTFLLGKRRKASGNKIRIFWLLLFAAMLFVVGGEEISWGQRILGIATPERLSEINIQREMNLHNIDGINQHIKLVGTLFMLVFCYLLPFSNHYMERASHLYRNLRLPMFPLNGIVILTIGIGLMTTYKLLRIRTGDNMDEIGELYVSLAWFIFAVKEYLDVRLVQKSESNPSV